MFFLPIFITLYYIFHGYAKVREYVLLLGSYYFYISSGWQYSLLLTVSILLNYVAGWKIGSTGNVSLRRAYLTLSLIFNLGILCTFKYSNFFTACLVNCLSLLGFRIEVAYISLALPIGISFYTFQGISYLIDVYRIDTHVERSLVKFAIFMTFFPKLLAGPLVRASSFFPQLYGKALIHDKKCQAGFLLIFIGLIKKIVIADLLASLAIDQIFRSPVQFSSLDLLLGLYGYAFQLYNDFSGYTDIAIGIGLLVGFDLPQNFNSPYLSKNIRDFWQRWHITLSTWFKDYLYIPLGGNHGSQLREVFNLLTTMVLCGLWHGAGVNFIIWGAYHGVFLAINHLLGKKEISDKPGMVFLKRIGCFHLIVFGWLLFRVSSMNNFVDYLKGISKLTTNSNLSPLFVMILIVAALFHYLPSNLYSKMKTKYIELPVPLQAAVYAGLLVLFIGTSLKTPEFIYFQF
jgi:alginate O-acetyltransferase complex protein AlgI